MRSPTVQIVTDVNGLMTARGVSDFMVGVHGNINNPISFTQTVGMVC
jgi:hypothetical protein